MIEQLVVGFDTIFTPTNLIIFSLGLTLGLLTGAIPGLNGTMTVVLLIPLTYSLNSTTAILLLSVIYVGSVYAGSISAIMFRVPGAPEAIMTTLDGYPMNQQGRMEEAISIAVFSSAVGGTVGVLILIGFSPPLAEWSRTLSDPEYFSLIIVGLALVTTIGANNIIKSAITMFIGLFLATVGLDPLAGSPRYSFGENLLLNGVELIPMILGLFAISEVLKQLYSGGQMVSDVQDVGKIRRRNLLPPFRYFSRFKRILGFNSIAGTLIGILPGAGATTGALFGYTFGQRISPKHIRERFGTGVPEGVAAPETANNAAASGAFVPLFALGIPGSGTTAVILAAFVLHGLTPGPSFISDNESLVYTVFVALLLANLSLLLFNQLVVEIFSKIRDVPQELLFTLIIVFSVIGAFSTRNITFDLWVMLVAGVLAFYIQQHDYPVAPLIIGLVLGPIAEPSLRRGLIKSSGDIAVFINRPISLILLTAAVLLFFVPLILDNKFIKDYMRGS